MSRTPIRNKGRSKLSESEISSASPIERESQKTLFEDSPSIRLRPRTRPPLVSSSLAYLSRQLTRDVPPSNSLTKLQMERWSLIDQVKSLEGQLQTRDMLIEENQKLREDFDKVQSDHDTLKSKYTELTRKLSLFIDQEKADRQQVDNQIQLLRKQGEVLQEERDFAITESSRLRRDIDILQSENTRIKSSVTDSIDRTFHQRQIEDLKSENNQLRVMMEDSIPKALYSRLEQQLTDSLSSASSNTGNMRELHIENQKLKSRINAVEIHEMELVVKIKALESHLVDSQNQSTNLKREIDSIRADNQAERSRITAQHDQEVDAYKSKISSLEKQLENAELHVSNFQKMYGDKARLLQTIKSLRSELESLKMHTFNEKRIFENLFTTNIEKILGFHQRVMKVVKHELACIIAESGMVETGPGTGSILKSGVNESLITIRECFVCLLKDIKDLDEVNAELSYELDLAASKIVEKDKLIDNLVQRMMHTDKVKRGDDAAIAKLRSSMESAERKLNESRLMADTHKKSQISETALSPVQYR